MRNIERMKRRRDGVGVAVLVAAVCAVASGKNVATANETGGSASLLAAASRLATPAPSENVGFWPRLGSGAVSAADGAGSVGFSNVSGAGGQTSDASALNRVETANFIGYSGTWGPNEGGRTPNGRTRLVDWTTPDASPLNSVQPLAASPTNVSVGTVAPVGLVAPVDEVGETAKTSADKEDGGTATSGAIASREKTPILRDEPASATKGSGSPTGALVSTFGALTVVLGAFFALIAFLKRTGLKNGGFGGALEIVDSTPVGDKTRLLTIRWGNRLILAAKTPEKITSLAEIADPEETSALLAEIERRKESALGDVGGKAAAIWKRGRGAASVLRTAFETKGRR